MSHEQQQRAGVTMAARSLGLSDRALDTVDDVREALEVLQRHKINLLGPVASIDSIPSGYALAFRVLLFPTDGYPSGGDWKRVGDRNSNGIWYQTDGGGLALHKVALRQLAAAAGLSWDVRLDVSGARWIASASGRFRTLDGQWRQVTAAKDLDLSDEGPTAESWRASEKRPGDAQWRLHKARETGGRVAESKAINAMIRDALCVRSSYTLDQAGAPFVVPVLIWTPSTPEARTMQAAAELGLTSALYGPRMIAPVLDVEPVAREPEPDPVRAEPEPEPLTLTPEERLYCAARRWPVPTEQEQIRKLREHVQGKGADVFRAFLQDGPEW